MELIARFEAVKRFDQKIHDESGRDWTWADLGLPLKASIINRRSTSQDFLPFTFPTNRHLIASLFELLSNNGAPVMLSRASW
jgi:hypothetical protein